MNNFFYLNPLFRELDRLQRDLGQFGSATASLRASRPGSFPAINVGSTDDSFEIVAFLPGIDPKSVELTIDRGLVSLSGERKEATPEAQTKAHASERFSGRFRRVVELPDTADTSNAEAHYADGCLTISIRKKETSAPKQITIQ